MEFPFTSSQWKELERQAIIYKYMSSSIPVPPHLLILPNNNIYAAGNNSKDLEPGRCRRSDGKKWRCAKEAAPDHKYCERHMHRPRPRSRKPVELRAAVDENNNNNNNNRKKMKKKTSLKNTDAFAVTTTVQPNNFPPIQLTGTNTNRNIGWMIDDKMVGINGAKQQWPSLIDTKTAIPSAGSVYDYYTPYFQQNYGGEPLNLFSYTDLAAPGDVHQNYDSQFFLNSDMVSLNNHSRGFIDAWSNDNFKTTTTTQDGSVSSSLGDHSPCSLTLSMAMAADNSLDKEMLKIQDGYGYVKEPKDSSWVSTTTATTPWVPYSQGGPLAEVLHSGGSYATYGGDTFSTPASPSGVLHRALFSQSDTSVCNSPILPPPELQNKVVGFQWFH